MISLHHKYKNGLIQKFRSYGYLKESGDACFDTLPNMIVHVYMRNISFRKQTNDISSNYE